MSSSRIDEFEVVVVGAGPGGMAAAVTLASRGVETLVIERRTAISHLPRATVASTGTMELLRRWGLEEAAWQRSLDVEWTAWACPTLADARHGEAIEVGMPTRGQAALISPSRPACLPQDELEPLLEEHLATLPSARLERGVELLSLERLPTGGFLLSVAGPDGGRRRARARYVVGADGIRSRVRGNLGIATAGDEHLESRMGVLFRAPLWPLVGERRHGIYFITDEPEGRAFIPAGGGDRWIFATGASEEAELSDSRAQEQIRSAAGDRSLPVEIIQARSVSFGVAIAERFREGDAFLVGDAAHRVTPRGGTGLNTAMRDGFDLGWKLAWVLRGWAGEELLDSYEAERRPVAEHNTERSSRPDGSILGTGIGLSADLGGRIPHVWVARGEGLVSTLDLLGDGLTLLAGPAWEGAVPPSAAPLRVERLDAIAAHALGLSASGTLLVRPDGRPVALHSDRDLFDMTRERSAHAR